MDLITASTILVARAEVGVIWLFSMMPLPVAFNGVLPSSTNASTGGVVYLAMESVETSTQGGP